MYERLTKSKEIDATVHDENNMNKTPAFKKYDIEQSLNGTIKVLQNCIKESDEELLVVCSDVTSNFVKGEKSAYLSAIELIKEMHPAIFHCCSKVGGK